jgi:hypothetical protein
MFIPLATEAEADLLGVALLLNGCRVGLSVFGHDGGGVSVRWWCW